MTDSSFKGWYNRNHLPHFDTDAYPQMITYRLADSLPRHVVARILEETEPDEKERLRRFEKLLDNGHGSCVLERPECAEIVVENLRYHDGERYRLLDWVVMPNHVHVCYDRPRQSMQDLVRNWKSYTSNEIKKVLGRLGDGEPLWQESFHDRFARDERHLTDMQGYILFNPVKAGLVDDPFEWPYSSIGRHVRFRDSIMRWWQSKKGR